MQERKARRAIAFLALHFRSRNAGATFVARYEDI